MCKVNGKTHIKTVSNWVFDSRRLTDIDLYTYTVIRYYFQGLTIVKILKILINIIILIYTPL